MTRVESRDKLKLRTFLASAIFLAIPEKMRLNSEFWSDDVQFHVANESESEAALGVNESKLNPKIDAS